MGQDKDRKITYHLLLWAKDLVKINFIYSKLKYIWVVRKTCYNTFPPPFPMLSFTPLYQTPLPCPGGAQVRTGVRITVSCSYFLFAIHQIVES